MTELKPCPCGGTARYHIGNCNVFCPSCSLMMPRKIPRKEAKELWNNHPMHDIERLREIVKDSTDLHNIVKQQFIQLRVLKQKIQTACDLFNSVLEFGNTTLKYQEEEFEKIIKFINENDKNITGEGLITPDTTLELRNNGEPVTPPIQKYVNFP